ncbi:MAG TPA: hypothetical protein VGN88_06310, partial [Phycisphaerae bacterium]
METRGKGDKPYLLKTAKGVADPVLVRLKTRQGMIVLLAEDVVHEKADVIHLHQVRWVRMRSGRQKLKNLLRISREPMMGCQLQLRLTRMGTDFIGT